MSESAALPPGLGSLLRRLLLELDGDVQSIYDSMEVPFRPRFFPVVQLLRAVEPLTVGQLAERMGVSQPAVTQTLSQMVKSDLVLLERSGDRRARRVLLTEQGKAVCDRLAPVWAAVRAAEARLDAELSEPLRAALQQALHRLAAKSFCERIRENMA